MHTPKNQVLIQTHCHLEMHHTLKSIRDKLIKTQNALILLSTVSLLKKWEHLVFGIFVKPSLTSSLIFNSAELDSNQLSYLLDSTNHWRGLSFSFTSPEQFGISRFSQSKDLERFPFGKQESGTRGLPMIQPASTKMLTRMERQFRKSKKVKTLILSVPFNVNWSISHCVSLKSLKLKLQMFKFGLLFSRTSLVPSKK